MGWQGVRRDWVTELNWATFTFTFFLVMWRQYQLTQSCAALCDPMDCSMPGFPVYHQLPKLTQTQVHRVSDAIQSSYPLSFPSPPVFNLSQQSGQGIGASALVLPMNIQDWFPLGLTGLISLQSKELSRVFSNTTAYKHQFFIAQLSLWSNSYYMSTGKTMTLTIYIYIFIIT